MPRLTPAQLALASDELQEYLKESGMTPETAFEVLSRQFNVALGSVTQNNAIITQQQQIIEKAQAEIARVRQLNLEIVSSNAHVRRLVRELATIDLENDPITK